MLTQMLHQYQKGINTDANHARYKRNNNKKNLAKTSNWWFQKPLKKSQDICDTSVFNIIDNLMAKGGRSGLCWFTAN